MSETPVVELREVSKVFAGGVRAADGVSFQVPAGRVVALLGPSGCGKTTLLRLIAGFERPDAGTIAIEGEVVAGPGQFVPPERRRVGIVVQDHALFPHLTVAANVAYGLGAARRRPTREPRVVEVLEMVGLRDLADRYPAELSGGQQQRVAIARAIAPRPRVVLLDEPFANLDAALRGRIRLEVRDILKAAGATVVLVTHDQEEALSLADRVAVMERGRVVQVGDPQEVYQRPAHPFVARFVGEAALVPGTSDGAAVQTPLGRLPVAGHAPRAGPALAVVRPEALRLVPDPAGPGEVLSTAYFGHDQLVEVSLGAGLRLRARLGSDGRFLPGDRVSAHVEGDVVAFPA